MRHADGTQGETQEGVAGETHEQAQAEGVIRFHCALSQPRPETMIPATLLAEMNAWRHIMRSLGMLGQVADRYEGYGFGNLSVRRPAAEPGFFITASQTGGIPWLDTHQVVMVSQWNLHEFNLGACGSLPPSSEALTHAMIFDADADIDWVFHGHSPAIWGAAARLDLPRIDRAAAYGTPEMATAVAALMTGHQQRPLVFTTDGHTDGVFAAGAAASAGGALVTTLAAALAHEPPGSDHVDT